MAPSSFRARGWRFGSAAPVHSSRRMERPWGCGSVIDDRGESGQSVTPLRPLSASEMDSMTAGIDLSVAAGTHFNRAVSHSIRP